MRIFADTPIEVSNDGSISWATLAIVRATCQVNMFNFPFDRQTCTLVFASGAEDSSRLLLLPDPDGAVLGSYIKSEEWTLLGMPVEVSMSSHAGTTSPYTEVTYTVVIERKPLFFIFNLVLPCIMMVAIGMLTFCLAPGTGEKIPLCTTILLTLILLQIMLSEGLPPSSDVMPLIGM